MTGSLRKSFVGFLLLMFLSVSCLFAQNAPSTEEVWPEFKFFYSFNPHFRLSLQYSGSRLKNSYYTEGKSSAFIDYIKNIQGKYNINKADSLRERTLRLRLGYQFGRSPIDSAGNLYEHTIITQADYYIPLKWGVESEIRTRLDWTIESNEFAPRYRPRLKFSKDLRTEYLTFTAYLYGEYFVYFKDSSHDRARLCIGSEFKITRRSDFEVYYLYQIANQPVIGELSAIGLCWRLYFAAKHKEAVKKD